MSKLPAKDHSALMGWTEGNGCTYIQLILAVLAPTAQVLLVKRI